MKQLMECATKSKHHLDASGAPVIAVQFSKVGGLDTFHTYMALAESNAYELGKQYELTLGESANA